MAQEVVMLIGLPASGKSSVAQPYIDRGYEHLNRDKRGGRTQGLLEGFTAALISGRNVILDNTLGTAEKRKWFLAEAQRLNVPVRCEWIATAIEDCSINALHRMWDRYNQIFYTPSEIAAHSRAHKDPNIFPIAALFSHRKEFEQPTTGEGFIAINKIKFQRRPSQSPNKALILDYDDTLRTTNGNFKFPTDPSEVEILPGRKAILKKYQKDGYLLLGVSNQSGIARNQLSEEMAVKCFEETNRKLGVNIQFTYCPHNVPPICYCRKPQSGLGVTLIRLHDLNPDECIYVGDQTTDKTFATRLGFQYADAKKFFGGT